MPTSFLIKLLYLSSTREKPAQAVFVHTCSDFQFEYRSTKILQ